MLSSAKAGVGSCWSACRLPLRITSWPNTNPGGPRGGEEIYYSQTRYVSVSLTRQGLCGKPGESAGVAGDIGFQFGEWCCFER